MKAEQFTPVVLRLRPRLLALAVQFDGDSAEDAVQEALTRLWTAWADLPGEADAERLAVRLTKHACIDAYRRRKQMAVLRDTMMSPPKDVLHEEELREALERAIDALPPAERRIYMMYTEAQMDRLQIAAATGMNARSVSTMLSDARRRIMERLKKGGML